MKKTLCLTAGFTSLSLASGQTLQEPVFWMSVYDVDLSPFLLRLSKYSSIYRVSNWIWTKRLFAVFVAEYFEP